MKAKTITINGIGAKGLMGALAVASVPALGLLGYMFTREMPTPPPIPEKEVIEKTTTKTLDKEVDMRVIPPKE